jgi:hypothetical protein
MEEVSGAFAELLHCFIPLTGEMCIIPESDGTLLAVVDPADSLNTMSLLISLAP